MDKNLNLQGVATEKNGNYIAFELDISGLEKTGGVALFNIYRVGYASDDQAAAPFKSIEISKELINEWNKFDEHQFLVECNFGLFEVFLNRRDPAHKISVDDPSDSPFGAGGMNLNPVGRGNNFISFPMLADIGFSAQSGQKARFSNLQIKHFRFPSNTVFSETLRDGSSYAGIFKKDISQDHLSVSDGDYLVSGKSGGTLILADPSRNAAPMLRTEFAVDNKTVNKARLYVTARGILCVCGEEVSLV